MWQIIDIAAEKLPPEIAGYWWDLGMAGPKYVLYAEMAVAGVAWSWAMYRGIRWALGHKKALGTWWNQEAYRRLMQHLADEERAGRVLAFEEINALNEFRHGKDFRRIVDKAYGNRLN